jgi:hypothetical protein
MNDTAEQAARTLQSDLARLQESLGSVAREADRRLRDLVAERPLLAVGAAAGIGFILGRGLPRGTGTLLLGAGTRLAGTWLQQEFLQRAHAQENEQ